MYDDKLKPNPDPEIRAFEESLLRSLDEAERGDFSAVHTPKQIMARRGRPVGSVKVAPKIPTTLRLDAATLEKLRSTGKGWQTRAAEVLADYAASKLSAR